MAKRIFITATNTDIGKTYTTVKLMQRLAQQGHRVGVIKPIETGVVDDHVPDGSLLLKTLQRLNPETASLELDDIVPIRYSLPAAPFVSSGGKPVDYSKINDALVRMESYCDICLIEGAGGLLVPVDAATDMIDLIVRSQAKALLVSHCRLGCINDTRLSLEALRRREIDFIWLLNCRPDDQNFSLTSQPWFDAAFDNWYRLDRDLDAICNAVLL